MRPRPTLNCNLISRRILYDCDNGDGIDVFIADKHGIIKKRFDASRQTLVSEGRVSFAEDYFDLGFVEVEKRLLLRSVDKS